MKKQYKIIRTLVRRDRPLEVDAYTKPATIPVGESPAAKFSK